MPRAKKIKGRRQTRLPRTLLRRRKENGRPRGTYKRFLFEQTHLGFFLKYEVPLVYEIIMSMTPQSPFLEPPYLLVQKICEASDDSSLRKPKFARYLQEYKQHGLFCHQGVKLTPVKEAYYKGIRDKKLHRYIARNSSRIERLRNDPTAAHLPELSKILSAVSCQDK